MKLTVRDRVILMVAALAIACYGGYHMLWLPGVAQTAALEAKKTELEGLAVDITPLLKQAEALKSEESGLQKKVDDIRENGRSLTLTKEDFLMLLGDASVKNNVKLLRFNDFGPTNEEGVWTATFDFELQGSAHGINSLLSDINNIGVKQSAGSVSYRQTGENPYLKRFFDEYTNLPWYVEPTPTAQPLPDQMPAGFPEISPESGSVYNEWPQQIPKIEPNPAITPEPAQEAGPSPTPEMREDNITDRLNKLLETACWTVGYRIRLLNNTEGTGPIDVGGEMRLAVTVRFTMFNEPSLANSFRKEGV